MNEEMQKNLGPLRSLAGTWEGVTGNDTAPGDDRGTEENKFKERMVLEPTGLTANHEQELYALRYHLQAWRIGESDPFHDETGYWIWDAQAKQVMKCVTIPRGVSLIAGGEAEAGSKQFKVTARRGSGTFGICSNPFLEKEFQTVGFELEMNIIDDDSFSYDEVTRIQIKGKQGVFEHRDRNTLNRVKK